jgi:hypothetical protein
LSLTRFATYDPVEVRESAATTTPPANSTAIIDVLERKKEINFTKRDKKKCEKYIHPSNVLLFAIHFQFVSSPDVPSLNFLPLNIKIYLTFYIL